MSRRYFRPIPVMDAAAHPGALPLAGGPLSFHLVEVLARGRPPEILPAAVLAAEDVARLTAPRPPIAGLGWDRPRIMGILNVTPDSFSDGGRFAGPEEAAAAGLALAEAGADVVDIGGESTRPGADPVDPAAEAARVLPVIETMASARPGPILSIDTRNPSVARAAIRAGVGLWNDVSALSHAPDSLATARALGCPLCLMHAKGEPKTMAEAPAYDDVLLDVYDALEARLAAVTAAAAGRAGVLIDPGLGFGKDLGHNLALIRRISLFHGLGCPILFGASRKRFIGTLSGVAAPAARMPGSLAVALYALGQGVQMLRVHDVAETRQASLLWQAMLGPETPANGAGA